MSDMPNLRRLVSQWLQPDTRAFFVSEAVIKMLLLPHRAKSYIQTQHRERGQVGVVRERVRIAYKCG